MSRKEKAALRSFRDVVGNFLGDNESPDYREIVKQMLVSFRPIGCIKLHFLFSYIDYLLRILELYQRSRVKDSTKN